mmetsp:Transcript_8556/g.13128  ORF Transcript_8556/g.13128 Transcript_8556/m.13128 type:complete len:429 (+) Transcript_8556:43-1329(+)
MEISVLILVFIILMSLLTRATSENLVPINSTGQLLLSCGIKLNDGFIHVLFSRGSLVPNESDLVLTASEEKVSIILACGARLVNKATSIIASCDLTLPVATNFLSTQIAIKVKLFSNGAAHLRALALTADGSSTTASASKPTSLLKNELPLLFRFERIQESLHTLVFNNNVRLRLASEYRSGSDGGSHLPLDSDGDVLPVYTSTRLWPAAYALTKIIVKISYLLKEKRILELGAGIGVPGLISAKLGAASVVLSDLPNALPNIEINAIANNLSSPLVRTVALDWYQPSESSISEEVFDVLLAADCVFWPHLFTPFLNVVQHFFTVSSSIILLLTITKRLDRVENFLLELHARAKIKHWHIVGPLVPSSLSMPTNTDFFAISPSSPRSLSVLSEVEKVLTFLDNGGPTLSVHLDNQGQLRPESPLLLLE